MENGQAGTRSLRPKEFAHVDHAAGAQGVGAAGRVAQHLLSYNDPTWLAERHAPAHQAETSIAVLAAPLPGLLPRQRGPRRLVSPARAILSSSCLPNSQNPRLLSRLVHQEILEDQVTLAAIEGRAALATRNLPFRRFRICFGANQFVVRFAVRTAERLRSDVRTTRLPSANTPASHSTVTTAAGVRGTFQSCDALENGISRSAR